MTSSQRITTTTGAGLRILGSAGQRSFELVSQTVARQLTPAHAEIFAEPVKPDQGDQTDWYTGLTGRIRPLAELEEADKVRVEAALSVLIGDIKALAASVLTSNAAETQRLGEAIENAVSIPRATSVWVVETDDPTASLRPVIVDWATLPDSRNENTDRALSGWLPRPPPPEPVGGPQYPTEPVPPPRKAGSAGLLSWLTGGLWLLFAALTGIVLYLLLPACGLAGFSLLNYCPAPLTVNELALNETTRNREVLENRIAFFERGFALTEDACVAIPPPEPVVEPPPEPPPEPVIEAPPEEVAVETPPEAREPEPRPAPPADEIEQRLEREDATDSEAMIALVWNNRSDLDLHVTCPARDRIFFERPSSSACHGRLDVDMNAAGNRMSNEPIEHIYFTQPEAGRYRIDVVLYNPGNYPGPHNFQVRVTFGNDTRQFSGTVSRRSPRWSTTYDYAP